MASIKPEFNMKIIDDEFRKECRKLGGKVEESRIDIVCILKNADDFVKFSKWMKENILKKLSNNIGKYREYISLYENVDDSFTGIFKIATDGSANMHVTTEKVIGEGAVLYELDKRLGIKRGELTSEKYKIVNDKIAEWIDKFPIKRGNVEVNIDWDDDYNIWIITSEFVKDVTVHDDIDDVLKEGINESKEMLNKSPKPF